MLKPVPVPRPEPASVPAAGRSLTVPVPGPAKKRRRGLTGPTISEAQMIGPHGIQHDQEHIRRTSRRHRLPASPRCLSQAGTKANAASAVTIPASPKKIQVTASAARPRGVRARQPGES